MGVVVFGLSSSVPSPLLGCLVFQLARYPAVIHPSTSLWPMSDRARTLSEDGERKRLCALNFSRSRDEASGARLPVPHQPEYKPHPKPMSYERLYLN